MKQFLSVPIYFDLVDVRLFVNTAETHSLTHGAERTWMSLPAASARIKNIEHKIGTQLLQRTSNGVQLTPAGDAFLQHGRLMLQQLENLSGDLLTYAQGLRGRLRIFANTTSVIEFLPKVLRIYLVAHPDVIVDLRAGLSREIVQAVVEGRSDIGIIGESVPTGSLVVLPYRQYRLVVVTALTHPLAQRQEVTFDETLQFDYITLIEATAQYGFLAQNASALYKPLKVRVQVDNFATLCQMVESNVGIGIVHEPAARRYANTLAIRIIPISDRWAVRRLQICARNLQLLPGFGRKLIDLLAADVD